LILKTACISIFNGLVFGAFILGVITSVLRLWSTLINGAVNKFDPHNKMVNY
jgi:hypothetical protein